MCCNIGEVIVFTYLFAVELTLAKPRGLTSLLDDPYRLDEPQSERVVSLKASNCPSLCQTISPGESQPFWY
jgi:hypothetical protein